MKKKLFIAVILVAMCANVFVHFNSQEKAISKDLVLSNIEALAWNEPEPEIGAPNACYRDCWPRPTDQWSETFVNVKSCVDCQEILTNYWRNEGVCLR